jgi:hypothetical protein
MVLRRRQDRGTCIEDGYAMKVGIIGAGNAGSAHLLALVMRGPAG